MPHHSRIRPGPVAAPGPADRLGIGIEASFKLLRDHARHRNQRLTDLARYFVESATAEFPPPARPSPRA